MNKNKPYNEAFKYEKSTIPIVLYFSWHALFESKTDSYGLLWWYPL